MIGRGGRTATALRTVIGALGPAAASASTSSTSTSADAAADVRGGGRRRAGSAGRTASAARSRSRCAPTSPSGRLAPGRGAAHRPRRGRPADHRRPAASHSGRLLLAFEGSPTAPPPSGCAACCSSPTSTPADRPEDPEEFYDHQLVGLAVAHRRRRAGRRGRPRCCTCRARTCSRRARRDGREVLVPFVAALVPDGRPRRRRRVVVDPPRRACSTDARGRELTCASTSSRSSPTTSPRCGSRCSAGRVDDGLIDLRVHDLRTWTTDRHRTVDDTPYGGGAGHGDAARAVGRGARRGASADGAEPHAPRWSCRRPAGEPFTQALAARAGRRAAAGVRLRPLRGHRPAGARRGRATGRGSTRSRSATTCSTAARWPRW